MFSSDNQVPRSIPKVSAHPFPIQKPETVEGAHFASGSPKKQRGQVAGDWGPDSLEPSCHCSGDEDCGEVVFDLALDARCDAAALIVA